MRQKISGLVAAMAMVAASAAPAMACGFQGPCAQAYVPYAYSGCYSGCWPHERLPDPVEQYYSGQPRYPLHQYYYVNQGPTYSGPGNFAPYPVYRESEVSRWDGYRHRRYHRHSVRPTYRYGYREHVLRRYY